MSPQIASTFGEWAEAFSVRAFLAHGRKLEPMTRNWLLEPATWHEIADAIADEHVYDLSDDSERLDVVQLVCEALARAEGN